MNKDKIIKSLNLSHTPNGMEREIILELMDTATDEFMLLTRLFNFGKQQGIRQERSRKSTQKGAGLNG